MERGHESSRGNERPNRLGVALVGAVAVYAAYKAYNFYKDNYEETGLRPLWERIESNDLIHNSIEYGKKLYQFGQDLLGKGPAYTEPGKPDMHEPKIPDVPAPSIDFISEQIDAEQSKTMLDHTSIDIHADPYNGKYLTPLALESAGLGPQHKVEFNGVSIVFSDIYRFNGSRLAVVGYTQAKGGVVARSYYLSQSQGLWRHLPAYSEEDGWFDKGHDEDSLNLPIKAQAVLGELSKVPPLIIEDPSLVFYGTARNLDHGGITYINEVEHEPQRLDGNFYGGNPYLGKAVPPEQIKFANPRQAPNFNQLGARWETYSPLYGQVIKMEAYPSYDGRYEYLFGRDKDGRAWIAGVENGSKLTSVGVKENWITCGDLVMPLYEYEHQSGGYGSSSEQRGHYVQMWDNYLSKVPVIQDYQRSRQPS
jgi:hypothetical protein